MAEITTTTSAIPRIDTWQIPPVTDLGNVPRGELFFEGIQNIPAKAALDSSRWLLNMPLPRNWIFRIAQARVFAFMNNFAAGNNFQDGMLVTVLTESPGQSNWFFTLWADLGSRAANSAYAFNFATVDPNYVSGFLPQYDSITDLINTGTGDASLQLSWLDGDADATVEVNVFYRFRLLLYDVRQSHDWPIHTPTPVITV